MNATLMKAGVQQEIREAICGHTPTAVNVRVYGGQFSMRTLKCALEILDYGLTITPFLRRLNKGCAG